MTELADKPRSAVMVWTFTVLMLGLTVLCIGLGNWQMHRLGEKEALIAAVAARLTQPAVPLPPQGQWADLDVDGLNFQPVTLTGTYRHDQAIRIFTSLVGGNGPAGGPGYWIVTPFVLQAGGAVLVNRGFVPEAQSPAFADDQTGPTGTVTITGLLRPPETAGWFTPAPDTAKRIDWVRDPARLSAMIDPAVGPLAPLYIDLSADPAHPLPQGGETVVEFPNNHLGYAMTWYGFAIVAPVMLGFWLWRQRRPKPPAGA